MIHYLRYTLILFFLSACSSSETNTAHSFRIYEENGVTIAETIGGPKYDEELFTYEKLFVLDTGQSREAFIQNPIQFLADDVGNLFIFDEGKGTTLMFDFAGNYLCSIGQPGRGPGELQVGRIQMVREGILQFFDTELRRTTRFNLDGSWRDITPLPIGAGLLSAHGFMILKDDIQLVLTSGFDRRYRPDSGRWGAITFSASGDTLGVVHTPWIPYLQETNIQIGENVMKIPMLPAFGPLPTSVFHPDHGVILSMCTIPELHIYNTASQRIRTIRIVMDPDPVTRLERSEARETELLSKGQVDEETRQAMEFRARNMPIAKEKAFWGWIETDNEGYFGLDMTLIPWLRSEKIHTYRILSPEGEYLGDTSRMFQPAYPRKASSVMLPLGSVVSHGRLLILEEDPDTGEMLPTVYRIIPAVEGLVYP